MLSVAAGLLLLSLAVVDVATTVLHVQIASPVSNHVHRWLWRGLVAATRRFPVRRRGDLFAWGVPLLVVELLLSWMLLSLLGFALLYGPFIGDATMYYRQTPESVLEDYDVRPRHPERSFVRVLARAQGIVLTLRHGLDPGAHGDVTDDPRLLVLEEGSSTRCMSSGRRRCSRRTSTSRRTTSGFGRTGRPCARRYGGAA